MERLSYFEMFKLNLLVSLGAMFPGTAIAIGLHLEGAPELLVAATIIAAGLTGVAANHWSTNTLTRRR